MPETTFFRLLKESDKAAALSEEIRGVRAGEESDRRFELDPSSFSQVPTSPFAYWVSERVRRLFKELPPFEGEGRTVKQGLATADDFRFVRCWWEVPPERILDGRHGPDWREDLEAFQAWCRRRTHQGKRWAPFAKGGEYSPYYADLHLVVNWEREGAEIRNFFNPKTGRIASRPQNTAYYFRPGLTWPLRTQKGFNMRPLPCASTFGHKGPAMFTVIPDKLGDLLGISNAVGVEQLVRLTMAFGSYEVGVIQRTPVPTNIPPEIRAKALNAVEQKRFVASTDELMHLFSAPAFVRGEMGLAERTAEHRDKLVNRSDRLRTLQWEIDTLAFDAYGFTEADRRAVVEEVPQPELIDRRVDPKALAADLVSYCVGVVFGRWDVRFATEERETPELPDPFDPLPVCPPGMLQGEDGLPLRQAPPGYPIEIESDGILVDAEGHPGDDIVARVRGVLGLLFGERAEAVEVELVELLGVKSLRAYFARTGGGGFWADHVKRYSASRRTATIYWLLSSPGGEIRFWIYAHRFDRDTLPKILGPRYLGAMIEGAKQALDELKPGGTPRPELGRRELARLAEIEDRLVELEEMAGVIRKILERTDDRGEVAGYEPYLDDGVVLAAAPLHELIPWPKKAKYRGRSVTDLALKWGELSDGKYDWSRTAMLYWPERVRARCAEDRSLAITHGLATGEE